MALKDIRRSAKGIWQNIILRLERLLALILRYERCYRAWTGAGAGEWAGISSLNAEIRGGCLPCLIKQ